MNHRDYMSEQAGITRDPYTSRSGMFHPVKMEDAPKASIVSRAERIASDAVRFTLADAQAAADAWKFNCGPGALCAVLEMTPDEIRPHLLDFERKGYTTPTLMAGILRRLGVTFRRVFETTSEPDAGRIIWPSFGVVRIQWAGPWTKPGVPIRARYRHTHWIAYRDTFPHGECFDVNAICAGGWLPFNEWANEMVPWLLKQIEPKSEGMWWPTHCWEIDQCQAKQT